MKNTVENKQLSHNDGNTMLGDMHYEKFIEKFPNSILVDKVFGDGNKLIYIGFNEHCRIGLRYLIRVDSSVSVIDMHELAEEIEDRSEEHTSELQSRGHLVCRLLLEK